MDHGGAQGYYGIKPDLTTTGKMVGGGMPIGVFGGRADALQSDMARIGRFGLSLLSQGYMTLGVRTNLHAEITEAHIDNFAETVAIAFEESEG